VPLPPQIELITATLDLQLVRLLRQAMRTADIASGKCQPIVALGPAPNCPVAHDHPIVEPTPRFEPRPVIHPTPRFEPRPRIHPSEAPRPKLIPVDVIAIPVEEAHAAKSPIEPPWKVLPWQNPPPMAPRLKVLIRPVDVCRKGSILDVFV
jgi:hypothetical protein